MKTENVAIIGAGPAGIAAGIQLKRYGIIPVIFEKDKPGGLLRNANLVENYPGFPDGISGLELANLFVMQLNKESLNIIIETVKSLDFNNESFIIETSKKAYCFQIVLIASGTMPEEFSNIRIDEKIKDRILYEIYPILNVKGKRIIIAGAGDAAFDYALNLGRNNEVVILNRTDNEKCLLLLKERVKNMPAISLHNKARITKICDNPPGRLLIEWVTPEGVFNLNGHYTVFAIGRKPRLDFLSEKLKAKRRKLHDEGLLFFAGDVKNGHYRQTSIAVGNGIMAAMKISEKLKEII